MSDQPRGVGAARVAVATVLPGELALAACLVVGVRPPGWALAGAEALVLAVLLLEAWVLRSVYVAARARGADRRAARRAALEKVVPATVRHLVRHELRALASLGRWVRRGTHGVRPGDLAAAYTGPQTAMMYGLLFVMVIETVGLAFLIPWPVVHRAILVLDLYGVVLVLALHAACVTRPHVVRPDGSLRIRYGALFDLAVPPDAVASVRVDRRYPEGRLVTLSEDGVLDLIVSSQTSVTLELNRPLPFTRPLGATEKAHTIRFHADDPRAVVSALRQPT
ncbi:MULTISPECIES: hypothetical protein [Streptomyces]|uniref:hypothetical protein n=1 Tax=Streptomyces TaxID=1883 RepID=UPI00017E9D55|nr:MULTISPECIES: hypothetical protein [Streptomyces]AKL69594.1 membrane protein [Streptomyces sp. Mg1]EDX21390.1 conserved hypothetical protein [Streptomyces sp. Mg1]RPK32045.1 hypothetical protein EES37_34185 [Streptomyces sp. ADI91-18]WBY18202.1 hypothetical protein PET44_00345 [Streptomyces goshikiensis]